MADTKSPRKENENATNNLLFPELSYRIVGCVFNVHKLYGTGHKESLYQEAFAAELESSNISYVREPIINVNNPVTQKKLKSTYRPDFIIDDKIIVEVKAQPKLIQYFRDQLYDYLHNSEYELGYLINFADKIIKPMRVIYTNNCKNRLVRSVH